MAIREWFRPADETDEANAKPAPDIIGNVVDHLQATKRPVLPDRVLRREEELQQLNGETEPAKAEVARTEQFGALRDTLTQLGWSAIRLASAIDASPSSILNWTAPPGSLQWRPVPELKLKRLRVHAIEEARQSLVEIRRLFPELDPDHAA